MTVRRLRISLVLAMIAAAVAIWADVLDDGDNSDLILFVVGVLSVAWFTAELRTGSHGSAGQRRLLLIGACCAAVMAGASFVEVVA